MEETREDERMKELAEAEITEILAAAEAEETMRMKELTEALAAAGVEEAMVPGYMIHKHLRGDRDNLLLKTLGGLNIHFLADPRPETIRCLFLNQYYEYRDDRDDKIVMVDDLGGEDAAREFIEKSRSLVALPTNQVRMIRLLKEAGFVEQNSNTSAVSALDEVVDADNASPGGNQSIEISAQSGDGGGASTNRGSIGGGAAAGNTGQVISSSNEKNRKKPKRGFSFLMRGAPKKKDEIVLLNQRGDVKNEDNDYLKHKFFSREKDGTNFSLTVGDVKKLAREQWGIEPDDQSLWVLSPEDCKEGKFGYEGTLITEADTCYVKDVPGCYINEPVEDKDKDGLLWALRHKPKRGIMKTPQEYKLSPMWPWCLLWRLKKHCCGQPWQFHLSDTLSASSFDENDPQDQHFLPTFRMYVRAKIVGDTHAKFYESLRLVKLAITGLRFGNFAMCDTALQRGYFATRVVVNILKDGKPARFASLTAPEEEAVELDRASEASASNNSKLSVSAGGKAALPVTAQAAFGTESSKKVSSKDTSTVSTEWMTAKEDCGWIFKRSCWAHVGGVNLPRPYRLFDAKDRSIPEVSNFYWSPRLEASLWLQPPIISFPGLKEVFLGDGGKKVRETASAYSCNLGMWFRKIGNARQRTRRYFEFSDSCRVVVMEGDISLAVFPNTISRIPLLLLLLGAARAAIAATRYFPGKTVLVWTSARAAWGAVRAACGG